MYINGDQFDSPLIDRQVKDDDESISGLLSSRDGSVDNYSNMYPSMSRSRLQRKNLAEEKVAQKCIQERLSNIGGERRRRKDDRYMI